MGAVVVGAFSVTTVALVADDAGWLAADAGLGAPLLFATLDVVLLVRDTGDFLDLLRLVVLFVCVVEVVFLRVLISASTVAPYVATYCNNIDNAKHRLTGAYPTALNFTQFNWGISNVKNTIVAVACALSLSLVAPAIAGSLTDPVLAPEVVA